MAKINYSIVVPVYRNEESIGRLLSTLSDIATKFQGALEVVFVVDGSPDHSFSLLQQALPNLAFPAQLLAHSRNFGSFPAIRTGLAAARGEYFGVMAADLQEPPELMSAFFESLDANECDVVVGTRLRRNDAALDRAASGVFWWVYRRFVLSDMPEGGVDVFGCNREFRDQLLALQETRSSLIALIFWLGFRRKLVGYERRAREEGVSAWTLRKKIDYMLDSIFAFTDYPIRLLTRIGLAGCLFSILLTIVLLISHLAGVIKVPGYVPTLLVVLFFGALNLFGIGLVGVYAWRTYENTKNRPLAIVAKSLKNNCRSHD